MLKKIYFYSVNFYSGFKASETNCYKFDSLLEAYKAYKKSQKYDFAYDDGTYYSTKSIRGCFVFIKDENHRHDSHSFNDENKRLAKSSPFNRAETPTEIVGEEKYIFDKDEYIF